MNVVQVFRRQLEPFLSKSLLSYERLNRTIGKTNLNVFTPNAFYAECQLAPAGRTLDVLAAIGGTHASVRSEVRCPAAGQRAHPLGAFLAAWFRKDPLSRASLLWLEWDHEASTLPPLGNVHVCVDVTYPSVHHNHASTPGLPVFDDLFAKALVEEMHSFGLLTSEERAIVHSSIARLPGDARLIHVSSMAARAPRELKLYVALPLASFVEYVTAVGGREFAQQSRMLESWADLELNGPTLYCDLTFKGGRADRLGLVYSQPQVAYTDHHPGRKLVRERLLESELCSGAQDAALGAWMVAPLDPALDRDPGYRLRRWLDLKICAKERLTTKAYLGFAPVVTFS